MYFKVIYYFLNILKNKKINLKINIKKIKFSESLRCLLSLLSDDYRIFVGYLGTEPSLFRMPITDTRYINLEARKNQLHEYEKIIWKCKRESERKFFCLLI